MDEYYRETSPYECSGLPGQTPTCPWPIPAAHGVWDHGVGVVWHHLMPSQPPTSGLQPSLSYVFRGHGRDCAQTQPDAQGAMSSLGCVTTCQVWAECPWEDRHEEKQGGIRKEASHGENVSLFLNREIIGCFLSCTSVLTLLAGLYPDQSIRERSGVVVSCVGMRGGSKIMTQKGAILLHGTWRLFVNHFPGNKHKHQCCETLLSLRRKNWSSCSDFRLSFFYFVLQAQNIS